MAEQELRTQLEQLMSGLPVLQGSAKQVSWATQIRREQVGNVKEMLRNGDNPDYPSWKPMNVREMEHAIAVLGHVEASWWIDNRRGAATGQREY